MKDTNAQAEQNKARTEQGLAEELRLTDKQVEEYKAQGFTFRDLQNAGRLSKETGRTLDEILRQRQVGLTWESITADAGREVEARR